ncbi:MAG: hypothetical protein R2776_06570 [Flavobacteriaceae bacterium]|nr:hypothetical protein [Flavobacteriaceae bacterium]
MFKKIIGHEGFWKSVGSLAIAFAFLFTLFKWMLSRFSFSFISESPITYLLAVILGGFLYGFFVTYGKFWKKLKEKQR